MMLELMASATKTTRVATRNGRLSILAWPSFPANDQSNGKQQGNNRYDAANDQRERAIVQLHNRFARRNRHGQQKRIGFDYTS